MAETRPAQRLLEDLALEIEPGASEDEVASKVDELAAFFNAILGGDH